MKCTRCGQGEAVLYFNDDFVCDDCAQGYDNCCVCGGLYHKDEMTWAVKDSMNERVFMVCELCKCGV